MKLSASLTTLVLVTMLAAPVDAGNRSKGAKYSSSSSSNMSSGISRRMLQSNTPKLVARVPQTATFSGKASKGQFLSNNASQFMSSKKPAFKVHQAPGKNLSTPLPSVRQFKSTITVHSAKSVVSTGNPLVLTAPMTPRFGGGGGGGRRANVRDHRDGADKPSPQGGVTVESIPGTARPNDVTGSGGSIIDQAIDGLLPDPYVHGRIGGTRDHRTGQ